MKVLVFVSSHCAYCPKAEYLVKKIVPEYYDRGASFSKIRIKTKEGKELSSKFGVMSTPTILILDAEEKEVKRIVGAPSENNLRNEIEKALGLKKSFLSRFGRG